jgi:hypothetical protein
MGLAGGCHPPARSAARPSALLRPEVMSAGLGVVAADGLVAPPASAALARVDEQPQAIGIGALADALVRRRDQQVRRRPQDRVSMAGADRTPTSVA